MTNPYSLFKTDENLEAKKGVVLEYPGFSITIHRAGGSNKKYVQALAEKMKPYRKKLENGLLDEDTATKLLIDIYAETIIVGWDNVADEHGNILKFSKENCVKLLTDLPELFKDIQEQANDIAIFKAEIEEIEEKN